MADRGEGAGDERHHLLNSDVIADGLRRLRATEKVRDLAREVRRDIRGRNTQIELGSRERALHGHVLGARGHHPRQLREKGGRGIAGGREDSRLLVDGDKVTVRSSVEGTGTPDGAPPPFLIEIFRIEDGRFAENWGSTWLPRLS